jgi:hypothetical protein
MRRAGCRTMRVRNAPTGKATAPFRANTHTELCRHPDIVALVRQLVLTPNLSQWQNSLTTRDQNKLTVTILS